MNMVFVQAPKTIKKMAMASTWIRQSSRTNCVSSILGEVDAELQVSCFSL